MEAAGERMNLLLCCLGIAALLRSSLACPRTCTCSIKKNGRLLAECAYKDLQEVPEGLSPNVTILTLSANRISSLWESSFSEVPEVQSLWLGYNQINSIEPGTFAQLVHLKNLDLSHNKIVDFPWKDLRNLSGLQILKMNNNRLARLPRDAFYSLKDLRSLWLNDNDLTTLAEGTFDNLPSLSQLQIFNNPFNCSCKVFWLKKWTENTSVSITKGGSILCVAPSRLKGRAVTDIPDHYCVAPSVQLTYLSNLDNTVMYDGLTLTLHCSVAGNPPPQIRWKIQTSSRSIEINGPNVARNGNILRPELSKQSQEHFLVFKNGTMAIPNFSKDDEGIYTCLAVNDVGTREVSVNVALAGSENPADDLLRNAPQASHLGGRSCYKGDELDPSGAGEKLVIVYHMPRESKSKAGGVSQIWLGTLLLTLGITLCC
ncbi:immunoglobulin superfamily containing leucine-rich repeat protein isoform X3 [Rhea pennata]|uniref:immunoglobulin superfamily containing leucine-rich repeat protein isoform X3 n=1 Tax=Rhea pennata TaxID=8795 RepID=UPI002E25BB6E